MTGSYSYPVGSKVLTTEHELREVFADVLARNNTYSRTVRTIDLVESGGRWLDVGCGAGPFCYSIAPKVDSVLGIDLDEHSIKIANDIFAQSNVEYRLGNLFEMNLPKSSFDGVLFLEVIEHVPEPFRFLTEIHRLLKPGGKLIISTPNVVSVKQVVYNLRLSTPKSLRRKVAQIWSDDYDFRTNAGHIYSWSHDTLAQLLRLTGFEFDEVVAAGSYPLASLRWSERIFGGYCETLLMRVRATK